MEKVRFGVVGAGVPEKEPGWKARLHYHVPSIAWARYFPQIIKNPNAELTAVCDIIPERLEKVRKVYGVKEIYTDYKDMLEKSNIDAVVITTPHKFHYTMAIEAIKVGKHLIVEKPLSMTAREAEEIVKEAKNKGIKLLPTPWIFDECFYKIREIIDKGKIGKVCLIRGKLGHMGPGHAEWFYKMGFGSGVTFDLAIYPVTTSVALIGPAKQVMAMMGTSIKTRLVMDREISVEVEDNAILLLDFGEGVFADISANYCTQFNYGPLLEIYGSEGVLFVEEGRIKFLTTQNNMRGLFTSETPLMHPFPEEPIIDFFIECLRRNVDLTPIGELQVHVIEILERAMEASNKAKAMKLITTFDPKAFAHPFITINS